jgi:hypothetical protein
MATRRRGRKVILEDNIKRAVFLERDTDTGGAGTVVNEGGTSSGVAITFATREETDEGALTTKAIHPDGGAYAYDRLRHGAQHTAGKGTKEYQLVDGPTIVIDCRRSNVFEVTLNGLGTRILGAPLHPYRGQVINLLVTQGSDGFQILGFDSVFTFTGGATPSLSQTPGSVDLLSCQYQASTGKWRCAFTPGFEEGGVTTSGVLLTDGDKGDITVSGEGQVFTIDDGVVTYVKMQDVSTTERLLGRKSAGAGIIEELTITEALNFIPGSVTGDLLKRGGTNWEPLPIGTGGYVLRVVTGVPSWSQFTLATLTDVDATGAVDGDVLTYDTGVGKWVPAEPTGGSGGGTLDALTGVAVYNAVDGDVLTYDGDIGIWIAAPLGSTATLAEEIAADGPMAFWKLDETSGTTFIDSGAAYDLTITGSGFTLAYTYLDKSSALYAARNTTGSGTYASRSGTLGFTAPITGDWTVEAAVCPVTIGTNFIFILYIVGDPASETEANNGQLAFVISAAGVPQIIWETGAGTDVTVSSAITLQQDEVYHLAAVKDGTANTVTFFVNGRKVGAAVSYANEPSGGSGTMSTMVAGSSSGSQNAAIIGNVAIYSTKLSDARIRAHAVAGGFI